MYGILSYNEDVDLWGGEFAAELGAIHHRVHQCPEELIKKFIVNFRDVPEFKDLVDETRAHLSPLKEFIYENVVQGPGALIGNVTQSLADKKMQELRGCLFPAYIEWCKREGYTQKLTKRTFMTDFGPLCESEGLGPVEKVRKN